MIVYPAIDLRQGKAVRLRQGDPDQATVYDANPVKAAERWAEAGAEWLHVVNLDGALGERSPNLKALSRILDAVDIPVQFGGGLREHRHRWCRGGDGPAGRHVLSSSFAARRRRWISHRAAAGGQTRHAQESRCKATTNSSTPA